jgi:hypothetical protein
MRHAGRRSKGESIVKRRRLLFVLALASALSLAAGTALAQATVKIGVVAEFSGPFADYGAQILGGMKTYLKLNGETFGGKKSRSSSRTRPARRRTSPSASRRSS